MALIPPLSVDVSPPVSLPRLEPQILWPSVLGWGDDEGSDSSKFPSLSAIKARLTATPTAPLTAFVEAARTAQARVYVLDDYLFKPMEGQSMQSRYDQILSWFPDGLIANDIRLLTNAHKEDAAIVRDFNVRAGAINQALSRRGGLVKIEVRFSLGKRFPYVHDRFSVIDNELWHFGATVGGLHNQVNAASRGWNAEMHDAIRFFEDAWKGDHAPRGGRRG